MNYRDVEKYITSINSEVPKKALEALKEKRVLLLIGRNSGRSIYIFKSKERDYLIIPRLLCTCKDYEFNVVLRKTKSACYHLVAAELAIREGEVRKITVNDEVLDDILYEVIYDSFSRTLRKMMAAGRGK
ncbi:MAG: hypothetical protein DRO14_05365 [Thermoprotei archaeon]|nr:MAG: hypothetical protein DRO14_05365 [Thermoprotei archaeon]